MGYAKCLHRSLKTVVVLGNALARDSEPRPPSQMIDGKHDSEVYLKGNMDKVLVGSDKKANGAEENRKTNLGDATKVYMKKDFDEDFNEPNGVGREWQEKDPGDEDKLVLKGRRKCLSFVPRRILINVGQYIFFFYERPWRWHNNSSLKTKSLAKLIKVNTPTHPINHKI